MTLNYLLIWITGISVLSTFRSALRHRESEGDFWLVRSLIVLGFIALGLFFFPHSVGLGAAALWAFIIGLPALIYRRIDVMIGKQDYDGAARLATLMTILRPDASSRSLQGLMFALRQIKRGNLSQAERMLGGHSRIDSSLGRSARAHLFALSGRWSDLRAWVESDLIPRQILDRDPALLPTYLRSLGETGDLEKLMRAYAQYRKKLVTPGNSSLLDLTRLVLFAFGGRPAALQNLLEHKMEGLAEPLKRFWMATALLADEQPALAMGILDELGASSDASLASAVRMRRESPLAIPRRDLGTEALAALNGAVMEHEREGLIGGSSLVRPRPSVTYWLIGLNCAVFGVELMLGAPNDGRRLFELGALFPPIVLDQGQWWRAFSASLLHVDFLHLFMNMLGLFMLGPFVELALGRLRYVACYFVCGVGSMLMIVLLTSYGHLPPQLTLGASGSVMGMIGASGAIFVRAWLAHRNRMAIEGLKTILINVAIQVVFDITTPQVSLSAHMGGFLSGILLGLLLYSPRGR